MSDPQQNPEILKHVKHLENQNHKLRRLLISTLDVADKNFASASQLQEETKSLESTVDKLEKEKDDLETLLANVLLNDESSVNLTLLKLEREHLELRSKLDEALSKINKEDEEIDILKSEDAVLKNTITELETTKQSLQERIKLIEAKESVLSLISSKLKAQLSEIEQKEAFVMQIKSNKIKATEERDNISSSSSLLDKEKELSVAFPHTKEVNEDISKNISHFDRKIIELERAKMKLYNDLEETIRNYSHEIEEIRSDLSDPEIKKLIHEIDIQKTVLMYNLKLAKLYDESDESKIISNNFPIDLETVIPVPNTSVSENVQKPDKDKCKQVESLAKSLESKIAGLAKTSSSNNTQLQLDQMVQKLENERSILLKRLHSVSAVSAQQFEERLLQTQSELHSSFMREVSSDTIVEGNNFDDATNQLYTTEEARLEQRIRELETDNDRIKKELYNILQEIETEQSIVRPEIQNILKQGIDELESKENDINEVDDSKTINE